jgi:hypothetical protein
MLHNICQFDIGPYCLIQNDVPLRKNAEIAILEIMDFMLSYRNFFKRMNIF